MTKEVIRIIEEKNKIPTRESFFKFRENSNGGIDVDINGKMYLTLMFICISLGILLYWLLSDSNFTSMILARGLIIGFIIQIVIMALLYIPKAIKMHRLLHKT